LDDDAITLTSYHLIYYLTRAVSNYCSDQWQWGTRRQSARILFRRDERRLHDAWDPNPRRQVWHGQGQWM